MSIDVFLDTVDVFVDTFDVLTLHWPEIFESVASFTFLVHENVSIAGIGMMLSVVTI